MLRHTRSIALAATITAAGGFTAANAIGSGDSRPDAVEIQSAAPISAVEPAVSGSFSIFRNSGSNDGDRIPTAVASASASPERYGRNAQLAKGVRTINGPGWAVPGNKTLCLVVPDPVDGHGSSCVDSEYATKFGVLVGMVSPEEPTTVRVSMLLPDGAKASVVPGTRSSSVLSADSEGVVAATVPTGSTIEITSAEGARTKLSLPDNFPMRKSQDAQ